ncbi:MAG: hypothetical protein ACK4M3_03275 [Pyrobaculum sp.]
MQKVGTIATMLIYLAYAHPMDGGSWWCPMGGLWGPVGWWWGWLWMALGLLLAVLFVVGMVLVVIWLFREVAKKSQ